MPFTVSRRLGFMRPSTKDTSVSKRLGREENVEGPSALNIVLYGETGAGKSSIINLIAGEKLANISGNDLEVRSTTFQRQRHVVLLSGISCALWDTTGVNDAGGTLPAKELKTFLQGLARSGGIHLIVYCIRADRLTDALKRNYDQFHAALPRKKPPVVLVVTGLEHRQSEMETWWRENEVVLRRYRMQFDAHACVTTLELQDPIIQQRRLHSQQLLRGLVVGCSELFPQKADQSFISRILAVFHTMFHRMSSVV